MPSLGQLSVTLGADTSPLQRGAQQAQSKLGRLSSSMSRAAGIASKLGGAAAAAGSAITSGLVVAGTRAAATQYRVAAALDSSQESLKAVQVAASDYGVAWGDLEQTIERVTTRIGEAARGMGEAQEGLDMLGLSAQTLAGLPLDEQMALIADRVQNLDMTAQETAAALDSVGIEGQRMVQMMRQGGDVFREARGEVERLNLTLSEVDAKQIEQAESAFQLIQEIVGSVSKRLSAEFAPIIKTVAEDLADAAEESDGFEDEITGAVDTAVAGFGAAADAVNDVRAALLNVQIGAKRVEFFFQRVSIGTKQAFENIANGAVEAGNTIGEAFSKIPGTGDFEAMSDIDLTSEVRAEGERLRSEIGHLVQRRDEILGSKPPSQRLQEWRDEVTRASEEAAEEAVAAQRRRSEQERNLRAQRIAATAQEHARKLQVEREARQKNLAEVRNYLQTERQAEVEQFAQRLKWLREAREMELMTERQFRTRKEELEAKHQQRLTKIEQQHLSDREKFNRKSMDAQAGQVAGSLKQMTADVARENKAMFQLNKVASIASAIINTHEGVSKALSAYPPPLSFAMAAAQAAAGFARVNAIRSQSFSKGGASGGGSTGSAAAAGGGAAGGGAAGGGDSGPNTVIQLQGEVFGREQVRQLVEKINEDSRDGGRMVVR